MLRCSPVFAGRQNLVRVCVLARRGVAKFRIFRKRAQGQVFTKKQKKKNEVNVFLSFCPVSATLYHRYHRLRRPFYAHFNQLYTLYEGGIVCTRLPTLGPSKFYALPIVA